MLPLPIDPQPPNSEWTICPTPALLRSLDSGTLGISQLESLQAHVAVCRRCEQALQGLAEESDSLIRTLASLPATDEDEPEFRQLYAQLWNNCPNPEIADSSWQNLLDLDASGGLRCSDTLALPFRLASYELFACLGRGATGAVYKARHLRLDRVVAIKVLSPRALGGAQEFLREMQAVGKLDHPNIIRGTDAGETNGMHFLVMEYVGGWDLSRLIRKTGPLQVADACEIGVQAAMGLDAAHQFGFIHRDIKPSNLLLSRLGQVRILDLGLATKHHVEDNREAKLPRGTADYMAPEQWTGEHAPSSATDIYGLGCTLYTLLVGHPPFRGQGVDRRESHLHVSPPSIRDSRPDCPHRLDALVQTMLAKDPSERPSDTRRIVRQLSIWSNHAQLQQLARTWIPADPDLTESNHAPREPSPRLVSRRTLIAAASTSLLAVGIRLAPTTRHDHPEIRTDIWRPLLTASTGPAPWLTESGANLYEPPTCDLDAEHQSLQIFSQGRCVWELGRPVTAPFRLRAAVTFNSPLTLAGFFFAGRSEVRTAVSEKENIICHRFHAVTISPVSGDGVPVLRWQYIQWTEPSAIETTDIAHAHSPLGTVRKDANQLEVQLGGHGEPMVVWNKEPVPWKVWNNAYDAEYFQQLPLHEIDRKFSGTMGLVCSGGAVQFAQLELSYGRLR